MTFHWHDIERVGEAGKFLITKDDTGNLALVASRAPWHKDIAPLYEKEEVKIIGAGKFDRKGKVTRWYSEGLMLETPSNLKNDIEKLLQANSELIMGKWKDSY